MNAEKPVKRDCRKHAPFRRCSACITMVIVIAGMPLCFGVASADLLEFTYVPPYGSTEDLQGRVSMVDPGSHMVAVYIYIEGLGWWTKPILPCVGLPVHPDSSWLADITTSVDDEYASAICAFLLPLGPVCPSVAGEDELPDEIFEMCVDAVCTTRVVRSISFSGFEWDVRTSQQPTSPDSNYFSDSAANVWVDGQDRLHLAIRERGGTWYSSEAVLHHPLGYGTYVYQVDSKIGDLNENVVLGMFIYDSQAWQENYREMDIEFAHWGDSTYPNAQFVVQPWEVEGNIYRWVIPPSVKASTHSFYWSSDSISFLSARGHQSVPPFDSVLDQWTYTDVSGIPEPGDERVTLNLWLFRSLAPSDGVEPEVIITSFQHYLPTLVQEYSADRSARCHLMQNQPNPFSSRTLILFHAGQSGPVVLRISDVSGRVVRTLVDGFRAAGYYSVSWDGRDDAGSKVSSGVYFYHLQGGSTTASRKMVLIN
jgi:hypothetical protein